MVPSASLLAAVTEPPRRWVISFVMASPRPKLP